MRSAAIQNVYKIALSLTIATLGLINPATAPDLAAQQQEIVYAGWGGSWQKSLREHVLDPFQAETGIRVKDVGGVSLAKIKAMVESKNTEWDVTDVIGQWLIVGEKEGLFEKLDLKGFDPSGFPPKSIYPIAVAVDTYGIGLGYNTNSFKGRAAPGSWKDFWDVKNFPGRRAVFDNPRYMLEFALLADGVPMDKLYPIDVDRAFRKLDELKPHISLYFRNFEQANQVLADGSIELSLVGTARILLLIKDGAPLKLVWNGGVNSYDYLAVPKHAKNRAAAMKFVEWYFSNPKAQAAMAMDFSQGPVHPKGLDYLPESKRNEMPTAHLAETVFLNTEWWADNLEAMEKRWNEWKLK
jgi:putative spermidine/putrescine transport system substrate-binding protein